MGRSSRGRPFFENLWRDGKCRCRVGQVRGGRLQTGVPRSIPRQQRLGGARESFKQQGETTRGSRVEGEGRGTRAQTNRRTHSRPSALGTVASGSSSSSSPVSSHCNNHHDCGAHVHSTDGHYQVQKQGSLPAAPLPSVVGWRRDGGRAARATRRWQFSRTGPASRQLLFAPFQAAKTRFVARRMPRMYRQTEQKKQDAHHHRRQHHGKSTQPCHTHPSCWPPNATTLLMVGRRQGSTGQPGLSDARPLGTVAWWQSGSLPRRRRRRRGTLSIPFLA